MDSEPRPTAPTPDISAVAVATAAAPAVRGAPVLPRPWLVADIGGTNARFGWLGPGAQDVAQVMTLRVADHDSPAAAARAYLASLRQTLGTAYSAPHAAALAVATAVGQDHVALTNSGWAFSRRATQQELGLDTLLVLNDFEALALSLPRLRPAQVRAMGAATPGQGNRAVIGPGTGLGVAGLTHTAHGWVAIAGEGGHASLSPADDFESQILSHVRLLHGHVSAERLLSGIGLPVLHQAVAAALGLTAGALDAGAVVEQGMARSDEACSRTLDSFCALLGSFAGNVALILGARGGVYIGGGIVPRLGERFFESQFRERFEAKGRFQGYLAAIPTLVIKDTRAALSGATLALEQQGR